ncbi:hypothetical protein V1477_004016 [Vespula maculifrons]|uniref:Uncharacterized protein n=1 Tax=Vespula maculifrons TaxID=7453 RepID=A0ABD2CQD2_VESMC
MEKKRKEKPKYESRARFFGTERRPAQKPTPMSPTHGTHPRKCTSHRVEVAAFGDPRTNGDSTLKSAFEMPFRFGSFRFLSKLEMCKTPLTDRSTVHTVGFRHLETRPVVSIFRSENQNIVLGRT